MTVFGIQTDINDEIIGSNPRDLWNKYKDNMSKDILRRIRVSSRNFDIEVNEEMHNQALLFIKDVLLHVQRFINEARNTSSRSWNERRSRIV
jgi:hypothetical protein